jgi:predicted DNA-binding antitoxin AbrB/MazE fold protein
MTWPVSQFADRDLSILTLRVTIEGMGERITAIYEDGVLRPLTPLPLPDHARVEIQILGESTSDEERVRVYQVLADSGIISVGEPSLEAPAVSDAELARIAHSLARGGNLSDSIAAERAGR